ncbi:MAG: hypothetical protein BJ554DRAFT_507, partial [Olpidium bornovanus]
NPNATDTVPVRKAIAAGFFQNAARITRGGDAYRTVKGSHTGYLHPSSGVLEERPKWVVYFELVLTSKEFMRQVIAVEPEWLLEAAPHFYKSSELQDDSKKMPKAPSAVRPQAPSPLNPVTFASR